MDFMALDWQSIIAVFIALLAGVWAIKLLLLPFLASMRPSKKDGCGGCCGGCGHASHDDKKHS